MFETILDTLSLSKLFDNEYHYVDTTSLNSNLVYKNEDFNEF